MIVGLPVYRKALNFPYHLVRYRIAAPTAGCTGVGTVDPRTFQFRVRTVFLFPFEAFAALFSCKGHIKPWHWTGRTK